MPKQKFDEIGVEEVNLVRRVKKRLKAERYAGILSQDNNRMNDIKAVEELGGFL